jgi:hypothetical protein
MAHWLNGTNNANPISVPLFPSQMPHRLAWDWAWISEMIGRRLTAWYTEHPFLAVMLVLQPKYNSYPGVYRCVIEKKIEVRIEMAEDEGEDVSTSWMTLRKRGHRKIETEIIRSHSVENSLWGTCRKTDYGWVIVVNININSFNLVFFIKCSIILNMKFAFHPRWKAEESEIWLFCPLHWDSRVTVVSFVAYEAVCL